MKPVMRPEDILQKMLDDAKVYDVGEENGVIKKTPEQILLDMRKEFEQTMQYEYKSMNELCRMDISDLQVELGKAQKYVKNLQLLTSLSQSNTHLKNENTQINQIKRRNTQC